MPDDIQETPEQRYARIYAQQPTTPTQPTATVTTPQTTPAAAAPPEFVSLLQEMRSEIQGLREQVKPQQPATPPPPPVSDDEWLATLGKGDVKGARKILTDQIRQDLRGEFDQILLNANSQTQAQIEMDRHFNSVRVQNPDLLEFEAYLEAPIARRVDEARAAGKVKTSADFVREYKAAVDAEVAKLRNLSLKLRASGKDEAALRNREVINSSTLQPQQVRLDQAVQTDEPPTTEKLNEDYFARRRADENRRRGLG